MDINLAVSQFASAHPFYAFAIGCVLGPVWPKALGWLLTDGVDWAVSRIAGVQKFYLKKIGASDAQIAAVEKNEAAALARAAEDVKKDADADAPAKPPVA